MRTFMQEQNQPHQQGSSNLARPSVSPIPVLATVPVQAQAKLKTGTPGDRYEQEADRIANQVMRMPEPQLQRVCACGGGCPRCQAEQPHQQHKLLQTKHVEAGTSQQIVPPVVHEILRSSGQPLAPSTRAFFAPRFGHDFSKVRIHTGGRASEAAQAVKAKAFTIGQDMVFGQGQYSPDTDKGQQLLAHELTHVVQQSGSQPLLQRENDGGTPGGTDEGMEGPSSPEQLDNKDKTICGPNITKQLKDAQIKTRKKFSSWSTPRKESACQDLVGILGSMAWDIIQLNESDWILAVYGSKCASRGASPACIKSVQIDDQCFYAGSVNYAHFGNMFDLCQAHYAVAYPLNNQFTQNEMVRWINVYKGTGFTGWSTPSANFQSSVDWAVAGFFNWPHGALTPKGDRANCSPTCPLAYTGGDFDVNWSGETF